MKLTEAPRAGWYPDPEGGTRLRWWDGGDWLDRYRLRPQLLLEAQPVAPPVPQAPTTNPPYNPAQFGSPAQYQAQTAAVVEQVRLAAREEAARATQLFEAKARSLTGEIPPLISQYEHQFMRWFKVALLLSFIVLLAWFIWSVFAQKSLFDWLGDRIDHITDDTKNSAPLPIDPREAVFVVSH
jgi:hypothetical protein